MCVCVCGCLCVCANVHSLSLSLSLSLSHTHTHTHTHTQAGDALDKLSGSDKQKQGVKKAEVAYGLAECLAYRGAAKMAGNNINFLWGI